MEIRQPETWREALELKRTRPDARPIAGGTDVMVEMSFDRIRPAAMLDLDHVSELAEWVPDGGSRSPARSRCSRSTRVR